MALTLEGVMADNLALIIARRRVHDYATESHELMQNHAEAMECRDCEDFLAKGIDAFKWLRNAEDTMREADYQGVFEFSEPIQQALDALYEMWLVPCRFADTWIESIAARGYVPDNLKKFREACEEADYTVQHRDWKKKATKARVSSSAEEEW